MQQKINWDTYFLAMVELISMRSSDPNTKVGSVIVNENKQVISTGYNSLARGLNDNNYPWTNDLSKGIENTKYAYIVHSESNAIVSSKQDLSGYTLYTSLFPCNECAKLIIQAGISKVIYSSDKYKDTELAKASKKMLREGKVELIQKTAVTVEIK
ncbi:deoxycytidylate deaminase [Spiroplasma sp. TIUS-1]|uniref:deoxycytidylate deaminase n=1 Tax=Spiroplasma sp. TIUS-1 TaxID=216963 RepID=UPI001399058B|nr:dCMP deaminase family protein [Spiroplasma sp. TIUS-1]QHX35990.1 deoxycytidylate deaminase [Spiroplasma sp. TIUS-1]